MKIPFRKLGAAAALSLLLLLAYSGCSNDDDNDSTPPPVWQTENSTCVSAACHGSSTLTRLVVVTGGTIETVPLYVDSAAYVAGVHKAQLCTGCHTDIVVANGVHGSADKTYGGWARFSAKSGTVAQATTDSTRNYGTAAATACATCHADQHDPQSAHINIPRLHTSVRDFGGHAVGENYEDNNCGRCHATCATCHFGSTISNADGAPQELLTGWDLLQANGDNGIANSGPKTEWRMDWTTNVRDHTIRNAQALAASNEVCTSCHIGFYRPAQLGFAMRGSSVDSMLATGIKRHPQVQELALGTVHTTTTCVTCHGPSLHSQRSIEEGPECLDCHAGKDAAHPAVDHATYDIKCIACHTKQRAADFNDGYLSGGQNNWISPETGQIVPVTVKYSELLNWYPHRLSQTVDCNKLCHFDGNRVGALVFPGPVATPPRGPLAPYRVELAAGQTDE